MALVTLTRADNRMMAIEANDILRLVENQLPDRVDMVMNNGKSITILGRIQTLTTWINEHRKQS